MDISSLTERTFFSILVFLTVTLVCPSSTAATSLSLRAEERIVVDCANVWCCSQRRPGKLIFSFACKLTMWGLFSLPDLFVFIAVNLQTLPTYHPSSTAVMSAIFPKPTGAITMWRCLPAARMRSTYPADWWRCSPGAGGLWRCAL